MGEVIELLGPDIRKLGPQKLIEFLMNFKQFKPYTGTDLLKILAKRSYYAREWSIFDKVSINSEPVFATAFFKPGRDLEGQEGVRSFRIALWSYSINFLGLPAGCFPTHLVQLEGSQQLMFN